MDIRELRDKVLGGKVITRDEATSLIDAPIHSVFEAASSIREHFRGKKVDLCSIVNAKSGGCSEDCAYCAQSARYKTGAEIYPLLNIRTIVELAKRAGDSGARRFCIVTSGRKPSEMELDEIARAVSKVREIGLLPCATLGLLTIDELSLLKEAGLERYHHNLESSEEYFGKVCTTHSYADKLNTTTSVKHADLSLCSGGIFGMGETWDDRIEMAFTLKEIDVDSVPINFLMPIKGTPLGILKPIHPIEALRIVSIYRFILPSMEIRLCGGRIQTLGEFNSMVFLAGADGLLIGHYLTQLGRSSEDDLNMIRTLGLSY